jgi:hypothetical protein
MVLEVEACMPKESRQLVASQWMPSCFLILLCICIAMRVTYLSTQGERTFFDETTQLKHVTRNIEICVQYLSQVV